MEAETDPRLVKLETARWRLATIWFPCCGIIILLLMGQSLGGAYGDQLQRAWNWALPNFLPTLALMVSVFAADALSPLGNETSFVRKNFLYLSIGLSMFYIFAIFLSIIAPVFVAAATSESGPDLYTTRIEAIEVSNIWLAPLQAIVIGALGVLFFLKEGKSH